MSAPSTHSTMLVAPARLILRRGASYNHDDHGPLSSPSSRFNFNHLFFSPLPSPSLPASVPRPKRASSHILNRDAMPAAWLYFSQEQFEMVSQDAVPDFPTHVVINDNRAAPMSRGPFRGPRPSPQNPLSERTMLSYDAPDDYFVDVYEAERSGLLPASGKAIRLKARGHVVGMSKASVKHKPVCQSPMTFVLETPDAGLGSTLMMMWTFYGLAKEQGRAFFINDSRWAYGTYTDIFEAPPAPDCRPPPRHHMVPCPFQARHLVVSVVTAKEIFSALLAKSHRIAETDNGLRDLVELAQTGNRDLFRLNQDDQAYVDNRVTGLEAKAKVGDTTMLDAPIIGLHIRHDGYIPAEVFLQQVVQLVEAHYNSSAAGDAKPHAITLLASEDPTVHEEPDFSNVILPQERILLASKDAIEEANPNPHMPHHFRKNNAANAPAGVDFEDVNEVARHMAPLSEETLRLRSLVGRAYMMDLAVLAGASDKVVCTVSAMGCRLLAVMMGWEDAIDAGGRVNVDGSCGRTGINW
ncbi:hypothetical protein B0J15DRAFT_515502 [Fusarium solani]|uniref:Uncharacterized protein n=1 Tax=Fusarium solani TaxID=169388 RepID=A0A9P9K0P8_FUSSL|nr:uncharacterized protein B0J15DRAFT_515502 [Fusarium solani]KAH7243853.1 hypothetical protein B0J15DRAFT_515502 [Fusarium solani]